MLVLVLQGIVMSGSEIPEWWTRSEAEPSGLGLEMAPRKLEFAPLCAACHGRP